MATETTRLPWVEQEAAHPELRNLLGMPFEQVLHTAIESCIDDPAIMRNRPDVDPATTAFSAQLPLAENDHAKETLELYLTADTMAVAHKSRYKAPIGEIVRSTFAWAVAIDRHGSQYYWSENLHGGNELLFALCATDCEELPPNNIASIMMKWYLSAGLYRQSNPDAAAPFTISDIPPLDLKVRIGYASP